MKNLHPFNWYYTSFTSDKLIDWKKNIKFSFRRQNKIFQTLERYYVNMINQRKTTPCPRLVPWIYLISGSRGTSPHTFCLSFKTNSRPDRTGQDRIGPRCPGEMNVIKNVSTRLFNFGLKGFSSQQSPPSESWATYSVSLFSVTNLWSWSQALPTFWSVSLCTTRPCW